MFEHTSYTIWWLYTGQRPGKGHVYQVQPGTGKQRFAQRARSGEHCSGDEECVRPAQCRLEVRLHNTSALSVVMRFV